jgi:hypothetical protein
MPVTTYTYGPGTYYPPSLQQEIIAAGLVGLQYINGSGYSGVNSAATAVAIVFSAALSGPDKTTLDATVAAHLGIVQPPLGQFTLPVLSQFSAGSFESGASCTTQQGGLYLTGVANASSYTLSNMVKSTPATPFHAVFAWLPNFIPAAYCWAGVCFRESATGKAMAFILNNFNVANTAGYTSLRVSYYSSAIVLSSSPYQADYQMGLNSPVWMRLGADGTNLKFDISTNGFNWLQLYSEAKAAHFTTAPDQVGFCLDAYNQTFGMTLLSYQETA